MLPCDTDSMYISGVYVEFSNSYWLRGIEVEIVIVGGRIEVDRGQAGSTYIQILKEVVWTSSIGFLGVLVSLDGLLLCGDVYEGSTLKLIE